MLLNQVDLISRSVINKPQFHLMHNPVINHPQSSHMHNSVMPPQSFYMHNSVMPPQFYQMAHHFLPHQFYGAQMIPMQPLSFIPLVQQQNPAEIPGTFFHANGYMNEEFYFTPQPLQHNLPGLVKRQSKPIKIQDPDDGDRDVTLQELRGGRPASSVTFLPFKDNGVQDESMNTPQLMSKPEAQPTCESEQQSDSELPSDQPDDKVSETSVTTTPTTTKLVQTESVNKMDLQVEEEENKKKEQSEQVVEQNKQVAPSTLPTLEKPTWAEIVKHQKQPENVQKIKEEKTQIEKAEVQKKEEKQQLSENKKELQLCKSPKPVQDKSTEENKKVEQSEEVVEQNKQVAPSTLPSLEKPTWAEIVKRQKQPENVQKIREEKTQIEKAEVQKKEEKQQLSKNNNKSSLSTDSKNRELYIWNLDYTVNNERLYNEFLPFGTIIHAKVIMKGLRSRGFGFVSFSSPAEAEEALKKMNGKILGKRTLYVSFSEAREGRETYRTQEKKMTESSSLSKPRQSPPGKTERVRP
ncbi:protein gar2-like isoform X2 [Silurus meridionalis]|uniref:RRM domain-containing protein n=1 Tax=Silurus meridionalis TaxID=175797 RepID=A0A8T0B4H5_SILME|nr:protein gar2-like isoform X2 [Silurus meridionalis]KAF7699295.1 hypothetical protein HF521_004037 [Silurus meridionalis]